MRLLALSLAAIVTAAPYPERREDPNVCTSVSEACPAKPEPPLASYRAVRKLSAANGRYKLAGWVNARTDFNRTDGFRFEITGEGGSGYIRNRVLRKILEAESGALRSGEGDRAALTSANYQFGAPEPHGDGLLRIALKPRRKDKMLIEGFMILTADRDLVRVEGRLAKGPSLWTPRVEIVRTYGRIGTARVPLETTSKARVLIAGESTFTMTYSYEEINGVPVERVTASR